MPYRPDARRVRDLTDAARSARQSSRNLISSCCEVTADPAKPALLANALQLTVATPIGTRQEHTEAGKRSR